MEKLKNKEDCSLLSGYHGFERQKDDDIAILLAIFNMALPYGLRRAPKPSKRMLEAGEVSEELSRLAKKRKARMEELKRLEASKESKPVSKAVDDGKNTQPKIDTMVTDDLGKDAVDGPLKRKQGVNAKPQAVKPVKKRKIETKKLEALKISKAISKDVEDSKTTQPDIDTVSDNTERSAGSGPPKRKREADAKSQAVKIPKKRKIKTKKPIVPKKTGAGAKSGNKKEMEDPPRELVVPEKPSAVKRRIVRKPSPSVIKTLREAETPFPKPIPSPKKKKKQSKKIKPVDIPLIRSAAAARGPQLTPDGKGIDLSPATLPSPETPYTPFSPDPEAFLTDKHVHIIEKKIERGLVVPNYSPFDIVSGGRPPAVSEAELDFWEDRMGTVWQQEMLPDRYGRLWRCVKMVGKDFQKEVRWDKGGTQGGAAAEEDVSPGSATENFEREVEHFLRAFEEDLPEWSVLEEVENLDFGED